MHCQHIFWRNIPWVLSTVLSVRMEKYMVITLIILIAMMVRNCADESLYKIYDQELFRDHPKHSAVMSLLSSCDKAKPYISLSAYSTDMINHTISGHGRLHHQQIVELVQKTDVLLAANPYSPVITASIGLLGFTIYDIIHQQTNTSNGQPMLCYEGGVHNFTSKRCNDEDTKYPLAERSEFLGGNGYDFHMVSEGHARYWSPVRDNRDGTYSVRVRVDDPGLYRIDLLLNDRKGCQYADCDIPWERCDNFLYYNLRVKHCQIDGNCVKNISSFYVNLTDSEHWPPYKHSLPDQSTTYTLPNCTVHEMGVMPGRWLSPSYLLERYKQSISPFHNPVDPYPFVWQPFDCQLHWLSPEEIQRCAAKSEFVFAGFSRERTNFYDLFDFVGRPIDYHKLLAIATVENVNYFSTYFSELIDRQHWNYNGSLQQTVKSLIDDFNSTSICLSPQQYKDKLAQLWTDMTTSSDPTYIEQLNATYQEVSRKQRSHVAFMLTEESLWTTEMGRHDIWSNLTTDLVKHMAELCSQGSVVYKTASALRSQYGSLSWQRMFQASRASAKNARAIRLPVLDSFIMTQPWIMDHTIYRDGLHLYASTMLKGNWVSKTLTMSDLSEVDRTF